MACWQADGYFAAIPASYCQADCYSGQKGSHVLWRIYLGQTSLVYTSLLGLLLYRLGGLHSRKGLGTKGGKICHLFVASRPSVTLGLDFPGVGACSLPQPPATFSCNTFHCLGLKLELNWGLYYPPPSSVTSVNGFLITHINQHDWKFLKFYWEENL